MRSNTIIDDRGSVQNLLVIDPLQLKTNQYDLLKRRKNQSFHRLHQ